VRVRVIYISLCNYKKKKKRVKNKKKKTKEKLDMKLSTSGLSRLDHEGIYHSISYLSSSSSLLILVCRYFNFYVIFMLLFFIPTVISFFIVKFCLKFCHWRRRRREEVPKFGAMACMCWTTGVPTNAGDSCCLLSSGS
jgi:Flp pilus assembly protein TadB